MDIRPLLIALPIAKNGGIKFLLPERQIELGAEVAEKAWAILEHCNGINTIDSIAEVVDSVDAVFVKGFLNDLLTLGIVIDSRQYYKHFHAVSSNPMIYSSDITNDEIATHVASPRMAVKPGVGFAFERDSSSTLRKLQELRASCRSFTDELLTTSQVGNLLDIGYALDRHAVASAGGLYPMKVFVIALEDQEDFPAGYYEYDNENSRLVLYSDKPDPQRVHYAFNDTELPFGASVVFVIAADENRQPRKYSNRGYRFMAIEAGEIAQNIALGAVEGGLATCLIGGMLDKVVADELELDGCLPLLAIAVGKSSDVPKAASWEVADQFEKAFVGENKPVQGSWVIDDTFADNYGKSYVQFLARTDNNQIVSGISTSWADAKLKAIAEGYERQRSAAIRWDVRSSARELTEAWLDPRVVAPLTAEQRSKFPHLQEFHEGLEIEWVRGHDYMGRPVMVPIDLVFYPIHGLDRKLVVDTCSSGFSAFTTFDEAVNRGILEMVERDALMRHWLEKTRPRQVNANALPIHLQNRLDYWHERGRKVSVLDLSQRGVIVTAVAITSDEYPCFVSGASSTLGKFEDAAIKAFHEAESRLIYGLNEPNPRRVTPTEVHGVLDHELLYAQSRDFHGHLQFLFDGLRSDVAPAASSTPSTLARDLEIVTVDVSEEGSLLKVVKVLSDKLVPISFGFGTDHYTHRSLRRSSDTAPSVPHFFA